MKKLIFTIAILFGCISAWAQETEATSKEVFIDLTFCHPKAH